MNWDPNEKQPANGVSNPLSSSNEALKTVKNLAKRKNYNLKQEIWTKCQDVLR